MSDKKKILLHLDGDEQPSVFDRVVAIDSGVEQLFSYGSVRPGQVQGLIHGCIFTRGPKDLRATAVFIGGSNVAHAEELLAEARKHLLPQFGLSVSIMIDANGSNTTAAAAVRCAGRHVDLRSARSAVLGTGPVGQRAALLLARAGGEVCFISRDQERARAACLEIRKSLPSARLLPASSRNQAEYEQALLGSQCILASGPPGVCLIAASKLSQLSAGKILIDLNAVPPLGLEGVEAMDAGASRHNGVAYGALGVGGLKMKIHRAALAALFSGNQLILDAEAIYDLSASL